MLVVIVLVGILVQAASGVALVAGVSYVQTQALADRAVTTQQQNIVDQAFAARSDFVTEFDERSEALAQAQGEWDADASSIEAWALTDETPTVAVPNPGGNALPGNDPSGRAFLDSIGATDVQVIFDAGSENCGYTQASEGVDTDYWIVWGGCYNTGFRNWLFLAWSSDQASDELYPLLVHEAMHWYQYQNYYQMFVAADRLGIPDYTSEIEADASCRAVYTHGVPLEAYEESSSPCWVDGWYEGWLPDFLADQGVPMAAPNPADYEVIDEVRP